MPPAAAPGTGATVPSLAGIEGRVLCGRYRVLEDSGGADGRTIATSRSPWRLIPRRAT